MEIIKDNYSLTELSVDLRIDHVISIHYYEYPSDFLFTGESHDFWELLYIDKGKIITFLGEEEYLLHQGQLIIREPNIFHGIKCDGTIAPNLVVIAFDCDSPLMDYFKKNYLLNINTLCKNLLNAIIIEAQDSFTNKLSDPYYKKLLVSPEIKPCSLQIIKNCLELLFIYLLRAKDETINTRSVHTSKEVKEKTEWIISYMQENIASNMTVQQICDVCNFSHASVSKFFKLETGWSMMEYFHRLKIEEAKKMIREGRGNISLIAETLGYSTIHYFSRQFKKICGMSPSEYGKSIKALVNNDFDKIDFS